VTLSLVLLNLYFNLFGLMGSFLVTQFIQPLQFAEYLTNLLSTLRTVDVLSSLVKSIVFGIIISVTAPIMDSALNNLLQKFPDGD
jgi:phospholipid/cholesterol/gamma-HCH transport system permease protein